MRRWARSEIVQRNHCATVCLNSNRVAMASEVLRSHGATLHDVALRRAAVGPTLGVKASGGILYYEDAVVTSHTQQVLDSISQFSH
jgi:hypothetical protein